MINRAIKAIRVFHGVSQVELAKELNISKSYLSEIENGKKSVSYSFLEDFAKFFDMPVSTLVYFSENIENPEKISKKFKLLASSKLLSVLEWLGNRKLAKPSNGSTKKV